MSRESRSRSGLGVAGLRLAVPLYGGQNLGGGGVVGEVAGGGDVQLQGFDLQIPLLFVDGPHLQGVGAAVLESPLHGVHVVCLGS